MLTIIWSFLAMVALALLLSAMIVVPSVKLYERISAWVSKARARRTALSRLRMWAIL
jgi:hypothetical protein